MISNIWILFFFVQATYEAKTSWRKIQQKDFSLAFYIHMTSINSFPFSIKYTLYVEINLLRSAGSAIYCLRFCMGGSVNFISSYVYYTGGARFKINVILSHLFSWLPYNKSNTHFCIFLYYLFYCLAFSLNIFRREFSSMF